MSAATETLAPPESAQPLVIDAGTPGAPDGPATGATLKALTLEAQSALHAAELALTVVPYRVGRESRGPNAGWLRPQREAERRESADPNNDLYLWEKGPEHYVSREHFLIERRGEQWLLIDRDSAVGTWVEGQLVGGNRRGGSVALDHGDVIVVGSHRSGFVFKFLCDG